MEVKKLLSIVELFDTDETIALTQRMIQIPSIDPPGNEADMSEFVKKYYCQNSRHRRGCTINFFWTYGCRACDRKRARNVDL